MYRPPTVSYMNVVCRLSLGVGSKAGRGKRKPQRWLPPQGSTIETWRAEREVPAMPSNHGLQPTSGALTVIAFCRFRLRAACG
jgi:hypothetical protein